MPKGKRPRTSTTRSPRRMKQHDASCTIIGEIMLSLRGQIGLSQTEACTIAELDSTYASLLEHGERCPSLVTFIRYVRALKADPIKIFAHILKEMDAQKLVQL